jgi:hypothetical protein
VKFAAGVSIMRTGLADKLPMFLTSMVYVSV